MDSCHRLWSAEVKEVLLCAHTRRRGQKHAGSEQWSYSEQENHTFDPAAQVVKRQEHTSPCTCLGPPSLSALL